MSEEKDGREDKTWDNMKNVNVNNRNNNGMY